jgi:putative Mn2+ efflux pump MntP
VIFALFEGGMALLGFAAGRLISSALGEAASLVGVVVLFGVGTWMVYQSLGGLEEGELQIESWRSLLLTSASISMDELAIGFSMGSLRLPVGITIVFIAGQALVLTLIGTAIGNRVGERLAERAETVAGLVLCGLALVLTAEMLAGR